MAKTNYYQMLGLSNNASISEIKQAYRKLAMKYHPDRNHGNEEWAHGKFKDINEAFSVLNNPEKRKRYDHFGVIENISDIFSNQVVRTTYEDFLKDFDESDIGFDVRNDTLDDNFWGKGFVSYKFKRRFGRIRGSRFESQRDTESKDLFEQKINPKVSSVEYELVLSKEQASRGIEKEILRNGNRLKIKVPAGIKNGNKIRLRNALDKTNGESGDIFINIKVILNNKS